MNLRIGSYNIQHGRFYGYYLETGKEAVNLDNVVKLIQDEDLDICGLQEVYNQTYEGNKLGEQVKYIGEKLGYHYMFGKAIDWAGNPQNGYGVALVSKYPIVDCRTVFVKLDPAKKTDPKIYYEDRVVMVVDLMVDGKVLTVINTHFGLAPEERLLAIDAIRNEATKVKNPLVLMGDLNLTPDSNDYKLLSEIPNLNDTAALLGDKMHPNTFPSDKHTCKIDYMFTSDDVKVKDIKVSYVTYTDHLPYIMNIEW